MNSIIISLFIIHHVILQSIQLTHAHSAPGLIILHVHLHELLLCYISTQNEILLALIIGSSSSLATDYFFKCRQNIISGTYKEFHRLLLQENIYTN